MVFLFVYFAHLDAGSTPVMSLMDITMCESLDTGGKKISECNVCSKAVCDKSIDNFLAEVDVDSFVDIDEVAGYIEDTVPAVIDLLVYGNKEYGNRRETDNGREKSS